MSRSYAPSSVLETRGGPLIYTYSASHHFLNVMPGELKKRRVEKKHEMAISAPSYMCSSI